MTTKTIRSRDGLWDYWVADSDRVVAVTHLPSGEHMKVDDSLRTIRKRVASGDMLRTIQRVAFDRDHARVDRLAQHLGREIQVDGVWHRMRGCNGYGPHPLVNVWVHGQDEPLQLPYDSYVPVRDPEPSPFTVIGVRYDGGDSAVQVAAVAGVVPVIGECGEPGRREVRVVSAPTADKAIGLALTRDVPVLPAAAEVLAGVWTVIGLASSYDRSYTVVAALPGEHEVLGRYDYMGSGRCVEVVGAESADAAISDVRQRWLDGQDDDEW